MNLNTHDVGGVSIKDVVLAFAIDKIAFNINLKSAESISDTKLLELHGIAQSWNDNYSKSVWIWFDYKKIKFGTIYQFKFNWWSFFSRGNLR